MGDKPNNYVDTEDQDTNSEYTIKVLAEQRKDFAVKCKHGTTRKNHIGEGRKWSP